MQQIVKVETKDKKGLYGWLVEPNTKPQTLLLNVHGTASNFYCEDFLYPVVDELAQSGIGSLLTNNRGADGLTGWEKGGSAEEIFEECLLDIDAWIEFALKKGYTNIVLSGHSLGTEKVVYYMAQGSQRDKVSQLILLAPADSFGTEMWYMEDIGENFIGEAKQLVAEGKGDSFLAFRRCHAGVLPKTADSFLNCFSSGSELRKTLPFKSGTLPMYKTITVPILAVISDNQDDEYTIIPIDEALALLKSENPKTQPVKVAGTDHIFEGAESKLAKIITDFIIS